MLALYHAELAVCAAKVRIVLAEKGLEWESRLVDLAAGEHQTPAYLKMNPNGVVPTLDHDGGIVIESTVINEYLDEMFPEHPMRPATALERAGMHVWTKREDSIHDAINTISMAILFLPMMLAAPPEMREARINGSPDLVRRDKWAELMGQGLAAKSVRVALIRFANLFRDMEVALGKTTWLASNAFTLADAGLISFFHRIEMLGFDFMWVGRLPRVTDWYERCKVRPSVAVGLLDFVTPQMLGPFEKFGPLARPVVEREFGGILAETG